MAWAYVSRTADMLDRMTAPEATEQDASAAMAAFYAGLPIALAVAICDLFFTIGQGRRPILFHCAAGKDRTGMVVGFSWPH